MTARRIPPKSKSGEVRDDISFQVMKASLCAATTSTLPDDDDIILPYNCWGIECDHCAFSQRFLQRDATPEEIDLIETEFIKLFEEHS